MTATKKLRYSIDEDQHTANWEAGSDVEVDELPTAEFDEVTDREYEVRADPDYDEGTHREFAGDFTDADPGEAPSQEYYKRSQK